MRIVLDTITAVACGAAFVVCPIALWWCYREWTWMRLEQAEREREEKRREERVA